jgi:[ribosomal protein S5]-alanine N-acetyltransferase
MTDRRQFALDGEMLGATLVTARLRIEPLQGLHARLLFDGMQDPAVYEWISMPRPPSADDLEQRWIRLARDGARSREVIDLGWAVQRTEDGTWIGKLDAEIQASGVATNVGYLFFAPFWSRGYASEAVAALSDHLARHGVAEQRAAVTIGNDASCRVLERAGFVRTRVLPGNDRLRGVLVDDVEYIRRD